MLRRITRALTAPLRSIARHLLADELGELSKLIAIVDDRASGKIADLEQRADDLDKACIHTDDKVDLEVIKIREELATIKDFDHGDLAEVIDYDLLGAKIDYSDLSYHVDGEDVAREIDVDAIAENISERISVSIQLN